jgi:hypothetical protein
MKKIRPILMIIMLIILTVILSGCANMMPKPPAPPEKVVVMPTYGDMVAIPKAQPTNLKHVEFKIMKVEVANNEKANTPEMVVLYSLDELNMQVMTGNLDDLQRYIREQKVVIDYLTGLINLRREDTKKETAK